ncbi:MAG: TIGR01777 family oxidoreductase [Candidatus Aminicenantes bacterium]|nr:TIGR01777 family oxidoreductase [Candidatus Aminicenantes bacterium]
MSRGTIVISGGTGFIGRPVTASLLEAGYEVAVLTRNPAKAAAQFGDQVNAAGWDGRTSDGWLELASGARAIINLAGENIGAGRWTMKRKRAIVMSRLNAGQAVVDAVRRAPAKPEVVIQASAVGYYGSRAHEALDESASAGRGFLAGLVRNWEDSTAEAERYGVRRVVIRSGLVLDADGGVLPRMLRPFRLFAGGPLGSGRQWLSWIHLRDEVGAIRFLLERQDLSGVFNLTAPKPLMMIEFARILGRTMRRPAIFRVPAVGLRFLYGEMAEETLLAGQRVEPRALLRAGFAFLYPGLENALQEILR